jgi:hypothetical protein
MTVTVPSRGILRTSSYSSNSGSTTSSSGEMSSTESLPFSFNEHDDDVKQQAFYPGEQEQQRGGGARTRRLPPSMLPRKLERRNVGKVERRRGNGDGLSSTTTRRRSISFSAQVDEQPVERLPRSRSNEFFYDDDEIARFRHGAFIESAGLDPEEFPFD